MKGVLCVSFGTSHASTRVKTIDAIEDRLRESFPDRKLYSAWSSSVIRNKVLEERGELHDSVEEAFSKARCEGVDDLIVTTTFLMPGREMKRVEEAVASWTTQDSCRVSFAEPLLSSDDDVRLLCDAICAEFSCLAGDEALVLMGHGSKRGPNDVYYKIQETLRGSGHPMFFVATVEGEPTFEDILPFVLTSNARNVYLAPLMIVAGDHANNDLAGPGRESWQSILCARGMQTHAVLKGLGEYQGIQAMICTHAREAREQIFSE